MVDQHWGWTFDVKKLFADVTSHSTGDNLAVVWRAAGHISGRGDAEDDLSAVGSLDRRHLSLLIKFARSVAAACA